jgi:hypothetical protein
MLGQLGAAVDDIPDGGAEAEAAAIRSGVQILHVRKVDSTDAEHGLLVVRIKNRGQAVQHVTVHCAVRGSTMNSASGVCPFLAEGEETLVVCMHDRRGITQLHRSQFAAAAAIARATEPPLHAVVFRQSSGLLLHDPGAYSKLQPLELSVQWEIERDDGGNERVLGYSAGFFVDSDAAPFPLAAFQCWSSSGNGKQRPLTDDVRLCSPFYTRDYLLFAGGVSGPTAPSTRVVDNVYRRLRKIPSTVLHRLPVPDGQRGTLAELDFETVATSTMLRSMSNCADCHLILDEIADRDCVVRLLSVRWQELQDLPPLLRSKLPTDISMEPDVNNSSMLQLLR